MPISAVNAFAVACDRCNLPLVIPDGTGEPNRLQIDLFLTTLHAEAQAAYMGWTLDHQLVTCPRCSPRTDPTRIQITIPARRPRKPPPGPAPNS